MNTFSGFIKDKWENYLSIEELDKKTHETIKEKEDKFSFLVKKVKDNIQLEEVVLYTTSSLKEKILEVLSFLGLKKEKEYTEHEIFLTLIKQLNESQRDSIITAAEALRSLEKTEKSLKHTPSSKSILNNELIHPKTIVKEVYSREKYKFCIGK